MTTFEFRGQTYYIDGRLSKQLSEKVIPDLQKKDKDFVLVVDGEERSGKSVFAMILGAFVTSFTKAKWDLSNVCMTPVEFRKKIETATKNEVVIYDEAHRGMGSRGALTEVNKILVDLMMEMGQKNLFVIIVLPSFFMLDRYVALFRARGLMHMYENKRRRGFWVYFSRKHKLNLFMKGKKEFNYNCMKWPYFRGRFYDQYGLDEKEYRKKKEKSFKHRPRYTKAEVWKGQRDKIIYKVHKELKMGSIKLSKWLKDCKVLLKQSVLRTILADIRANEEKCDYDEG